MKAGPSLNSGADPALRLVYAGGLGALLAGRFDTLPSIVRVPVRTLSETAAAIYVLRGDGASRDSIAQLVMQDRTGQPKTKFSAPASYYLHIVSRDAFTELVPDDRAYDDLFDRLKRVSSHAASRGVRQPLLKQLTLG